MQFSLQIAGAIPVPPSFSLFKSINSTRLTFVVETPKKETKNALDSIAFRLSQTIINKFYEDTDLSKKFPDNLIYVTGKSNALEETVLTELSIIYLFNVFLTISHDYKILERTALYKII